MTRDFTRGTVGNCSCNYYQGGNEKLHTYSVRSGKSLLQNKSSPNGATDQGSILLLIELYKAVRGYLLCSHTSREHNRSVFPHRKEFTFSIQIAERLQKETFKKVRFRSQHTTSCMLCTTLFTIKCSRLELFFLFTAVFTLPLILCFH